MKKFFTMTVICILISFCSVVSAFATGFITEPYETGSIEDILSVLEYSFATDETIDLTISAFDINSNGLIAVCKQGLRQQKVVDIYDKDGAFLYGYRFEFYGELFCEWSGENLNIISSKGNLIITFNQSHECIELLSISNKNDDFHNLDYKEQLLSENRFFDGKEYRIDNPSLVPDTFGYSKLIVIEENGTETVLLSITGYHILKIIIVSTLILLFIGTCGLIVINRIRDYYKNYDVNNQNN